MLMNCTYSSVISLTAASVVTLSTYLPESCPFPPQEISEMQPCLFIQTVEVSSGLPLFYVFITANIFTLFLRSVIFPHLYLFRRSLKGHFLSLTVTALLFSFLTGNTSTVILQTFAHMLSLM